ncbi:hypothetical protein DAPPUDRAFT_313594 [Daphnia pulex]|uniref:Uncharacterized protein n=1 Tax=Daphnia pulex TaxID=6669 RepID=E9G3K2_DAPPU|nr:hypothetical protein DAPPUDRAFT_335682 [Daphnia pulex]EFX85973.1 hypothetical protein DAPPUDRAFT_313594 [Daphnia pulex]|eukprot:EFX63274.1 hypothetical protein DAPPUDRAFT_335682 [Daphnia pulex]
MNKSNDSPTPPPANLTSIPDPKKIPVKPAPAARLVPTKKTIPAPPRPKVAPAFPKTEHVSPASEDKSAAPVKPSPIKVTSESVTPVSQGSSSPQKCPATSKSLFPARSNGPAPIPSKTVPVVTPNSAARPAEALGKPSTVPEISSSKATSAGAPKLPVAAEKPQSEGLTGGGKEERTPQQPKKSSSKTSWKKICRNTLWFFFCCCLP